MLIIIAIIIALLVGTYACYLLIKKEGAEDEARKNLKKKLAEAAESIRLKRKHAKDSIKKIKKKMKKYTRD